MRPIGAPSTNSMRCTYNERRSQRIREVNDRRMGPILTDAHRRLLRMIFDRGAEGASLALSKWLGREVRLAVSDVELVELDGPASCSARPRPWSPPAPWG